jgi:hypothetical protein
MISRRAGASTRSRFTCTKTRVEPSTGPALRGDVPPRRRRRKDARVSRSLGGSRRLDRHRRRRRALQLSHSYRRRGRRHRGVARRGSTSQYPRHRPRRAGHRRALGARGYGNARPRNRRRTRAHDGGRGGRRGRRRGSNLSLARRSPTGLWRSVHEPFDQRPRRGRARDGFGSQVVLLPNNKNIRPVADQVDALVEQTVSRRAHQFDRRRLRRASRVRSRRVGSTRTPRPCATSACNVVAGEVTRAVRDTTTDAGDVHEGDWIGLGANGVRSRSPTRSPRPAIICSRRSSRPEHELITIIEGDGATPANTRRITEFLADEFPDRQRGSASRRPAALPLLLRPRVSDAPARRLRQLGDVPVSQLRHVGEKRARPSSRWVFRNVFDLLTIYPRRYIDRTQAQVDLSDLTVGDEAAVFAEVTKDQASRRTRQGKVMVEVTVSDDGEIVQGRLLQSGVARAPAPRRGAGTVLRQGHATIADSVR